MKLLDKISRSMAFPSPNGPLDAHISRLTRVRSIQECIQFFESQSWIAREGLSEQALSTLLACCDDMRSRGLGLEPNLIGRAAAKCLMSPQRVGEASLIFGARDGDFLMLAAEADEKRDHRDYSGAEHAYYRALMLYPGHPTLLVQYAHMLKDQHKYPDALVYYFDAAIHGAPLADLREHALFVGSSVGRKNETAARLSDSHFCLSSSTLRTIYLLLFGQEPPVVLVMELMLETSRLEQVFAKLIIRSDFKSANRDLLRVVAETGWRPQRV